MIKEISKTNEINQRLQEDGKIITLDKPEHITAIMALNKQMEEVHQEYLTKSAHSETGAAEVFVN